MDDKDIEELKEHCLKTITCQFTSDRVKTEHKLVLELIEFYDNNRKD